MKIITRFEKEYEFLSNFYVSPFTYANERWNTVEHFFQAMKTNDLEEREEIRLAFSPGRAKKLGRKCTIRNDWEENKIEVMSLGLYLKFSQNKHLLERLLETESSYLVEGNYWHDNFWGDCFCSKCKDKPGRNELGKLLMQTREKFQSLE
jgi:hypothetical protein